MSFIDSVFQNLKRHPKRIVFPEGTEPRILKAAEKYVHEGLGPALVLGRRELVERAATKAKVDLDHVGIIDPEKASDFDIFCARLEKLRTYRDLGKAASREIVLKPAYFAAMMIQYGQADALVGGCTSYPQALLRPLLQVVKPQPGIETISSCMMLELKDKGMTSNDMLLFADCAVIPEPTVEQLAAIAIETGTICRQLTGMTPRIAMLSFSTKGSARMPATERIAAATALARKRATDERIEMEIDGELQVDSALIPAVGEAKAPSSPVAGKANVLIFPDLNSGNIAAKLVHYLAGARAYGQLLLGLSKPCGNVSRAATVDEILGVAAICGLEAIEYRKLYPPSSATDEV